MRLTDDEKIRTYEQYRRGETSEQDVRDVLGDDVVDTLQDDVEAFREAMERDT